MMRMHKKVRDERITQLNNQLQSEAFILVSTLVMLSIFIKAYLMNQPVSEYMTELIVLIVSAFYLAIRGSFAGYSTTSNPKTRKKVWSAVIIGISIVISIINGVKNYSMYGEKYTGIFDGHFLAVLGITFLSSLVFTSVMIGAIFFIEEYGQKRLEKKLDDDED